MEVTKGRRHPRFRNRDFPHRQALSLITAIRNGRRHSPTRIKNVVLNVVNASLIVDLDVVERDVPPPGGGLKVVGSTLNLRAVGVLERTDVTEGLGLVVVLITGGVLGVPVGIRGVT
jgi:hypothetical protein